MGSDRATLFLSDLHLSPERPEALRAFHAFAAGPARDAAAVYVLGDIFDWWVGDDQVAMFRSSPKSCARCAASPTRVCRFTSATATATS